MKKLLRSFRKRGFTLVELLVVIAIIGILVSIVLPAINNAMFRGRLTATTANGRSIIQTIFAKETESIYVTTTSAWPKSGAADVTKYQFANSTAFFKFLVTSEVMNVSFGFFTAPGIPAAPSATAFLAANNAWCFVGDVVDSYPDTAPVLFTRNLGDGTTVFAKMNDPLGTVANDVPTPLADANPFGKKGLSFVTKGAAGYAAFRDDLKLGTFTNIFLRTDTAGTALTNVVLRP